jgi:lysozyme family protein
MQSSFDRALAAVLREEGGFVNNPKDPGGATNRGITIANYRRYVDPQGTVADLKAITVEQAGTIYRKHYWDKVSGSVLPAGVDLAVFDLAVNSGVGRAIDFLQEVTGATVDGVIGPETMAAVKRMPADDLVRKLMFRRLRFLEGLKIWPTFKNGWQKRIERVERLALELAKEATPEPVAPPAEPKPHMPGIAALFSLVVAAVAFILRLSGVWNG